MIVISFYWSQSHLTTHNTNQGPEKVNDEEGNSKWDKPHSLQPAGELKVIYGTAKAEPARDGGQRGDEQETDHVTKQGTLLLTKTWVLHPLQHQKEF